MPAPKGSRNAAAYQHEQVEGSTKKIASALDELRRTGAVFKNITNLSRHISRQVDISDVSLRRNHRYRLMLEKHLTSQKGAAALLSDHHQDLTVLKSKVKMLQIELSNKHRKIQRLEAAVAKIGLPTPSPEEAPKPTSATWTSEFVQTAHLVLALVQWSNLTVNSDRRAIVDDYALEGSDVVAGGNLAGPFVDWFTENEGDR